MKTILISGAGGFLGVELVNCLLQDNSVQVKTLSSRREKLIEQFGSYKNFEVVSEIPCDTDILINCVFPANANGVQLADGLDYIANLYQEARSQSVGAVINISTQRVYSQNKNESATEESTPDLGTKYAVGKYAVEKLTNSIFYDVPHSNIRMASLVGPNSDGRISNRFVKQVIAGNDIHIVADTQMFGFLDVRDAATGISRYALIDPQKWEEVINLGSGRVYSLREIAECVVTIGTEFGYNASVVIGDETGDVRNSMLDGSKFEKLLNWKAKLSLEKTIHDAYDYYIKESEECANEKN